MYGSPCYHRDFQCRAPQILLETIKNVCVEGYTYYLTDLVENRCNTCHLSLSGNSSSVFSLHVSPHTVCLLDSFVINSLNTYSYASMQCKIPGHNPNDTLHPIASFSPMYGHVIFKATSKRFRNAVNDPFSYVISNVRKWSSACSLPLHLLWKQHFAKTFG